MPILRVSHYNLRLERGLMEAVKNFYVDVLGMTVGPRPAFRAAGYWLCANRDPILHLTEESSDDRRSVGVAGTFDHVALESAGWEEFRRRLIANAVPFEEDHVPGTDVLQVFLRDPAGNGVELILPHSGE